ncbi:hypothetical protein Tam10B_0441 [Bifidobacterium vansinderenii]|uniref:Uncharacterized protein n=1 Tax=Bifidobacterium vansinderenii TaxID=1984871 RepID=A0A229W0P9_9BIFI|nr:hypothetical protein Tam10B_0441 [Bifidobacterium vansinderenii]
METLETIALVLGIIADTIAIASAIIVIATKRDEKPKHKK